MTEKFQTVKLAEIADVAFRPLHALLAEDLVATESFAQAILELETGEISFVSLYDSGHTFYSILGRDYCEEQSFSVTLKYDEDSIKSIELPKMFRMSDSYGGMILRRELLVIRLNEDGDIPLSVLRGAVNRALSDESVFAEINRKISSSRSEGRGEDGLSALDAVAEDIISLVKDQSLFLKPVEESDDEVRVAQTIDILALLNQKQLPLGSISRRLKQCDELRDLCGCCSGFNEQSIGMIYDAEFIPWLNKFYDSCRNGERTSFFMNDIGLGLHGFMDKLENTILLNLQGSANLGRTKEYDVELESKDEGQIDAERWSAFFEKETEANVAFDQLRFFFKQATEGFNALDDVWRRVDTIAYDRKLTSDTKDSLLRVLIAARLHAARPMHDSLIEHYTDKVKAIVESSLNQLKEARDKEALAQARADEKERIMGILAHNIHGFLSKSVVTPMLSLERQGIDVTEPLEGVELLRGLIEEVKLTSSGNLADFLADTKDTNQSCMTLKEIITKSLGATVSNMLSRKFSGNSTALYFPRKEPHLLELAKGEFESLACEDYFQLTSFIERHFSVRIDTQCAESIFSTRVGNRFKTASRFLVLFQELFQNALKNMAHLPVTDRHLSVSIHQGENLRFEFINTFSADRQEDTRLGSGLVDSLLAKFGALESQFIGHEQKFRAMFELKDFTMGEDTK